MRGREVTSTLMKEAKRVLNAGSGPAEASSVHPAFRAAQWQVVRLDIDPSLQPDLVGSFTELESLVAPASYEAVWSSHSLEHLHTHEVIPALSAFRRVLKDDGFMIAVCPDLAAVARLLLERGAETVVYHSGAGPIRPLDMIYGHAYSIATGRPAMAHNTGFTAERLARVAIEAGFAEVRVMEGPAYDLWGAFLMPGADNQALAALFRGAVIERLFAPTPDDS